MSTELSLDGIAGSEDGIKPVWNPDSLWKTWKIDEIFTGQRGKNRYVPNVDDHVIEPVTGYTRRVVSIDKTTMVPTYAPVISVDQGEFTDYDKLLGVGPGVGAETFRAYLDKSVMPHTLAVDGRATVPNADATIARIYRGSKVLGTSKVISAYYDQSGTLLGQDIPLKLAAINDVTNHTIKTVPTCHTTEDMPDGEIVTLMAFAPEGHVVYQRQLMVENTGFIRGTELGTKHVTSISVKSSFLSKSDPKLIQFPINLPTNGMDLVGMVHYSDGSTKEMPVDNTRFSAYGWEGYVATIVGQPMSMVLRYNLAEDEIAYGETLGSERFVSATYKVVTQKAEGAYSVKLFGYPVFLNETDGYRMEWFLYNLDRNVMYNVTPFVKPSGSGQIFNPLGYGVHQKVSVAVDLSDVNGIYKKYRHVQIVDIVLIAPGTMHSTNWTIGFDPGQDPRYGEDIFAATTFVNSNLMRVRVDTGAPTKEEWIERLYKRTRPLIDPHNEIKPIEPDFFAIVTGSSSVEYPVSMWDAELTINQVVPNGATMFVKFYKRTADGDMQLAIAGLPVRQQN